MESMRAYRELVARVDRFLGRVMERYGRLIRCRKGCAICCEPGFGVFPVEAWGVRQGLGSLPLRARVILLQKAGDPSSDSCPALGGGACLLYPLRPLLCRTHGFPLLVETGGGKPQVKYCELNFRPEEFPGQVISGDCVLNLERLNQALAAINLAFLSEREELGLGGLPHRVPLLHFLANTQAG